MTRMLRDSLNLEAVEHQPHFRGWTSDDPAVERARAAIDGWDGVMDRDSAPRPSTWRGSGLADLGGRPEGRT